MRLREIQELIEQWAPKDLASEHDSIGLQIGKYNKPIHRILLTLDTTDKVISEARKKKIDLIISHHPLIYQPIKSITNESRVGLLIKKLIQYDIALYTAHTNLDSAEKGVSFALATHIGLQNIEVLDRKKCLFKKIVVYVPLEYIEKVTNAMSNAGAGRIGNYGACSFRSEGVGTFLPLKGANPFTGKVGQLEKVQEVRLEMISPAWKVQHVLREMLKSHPYEEVAYDIYSMENESDKHGLGAIGELSSAITLSELLKLLKRRLRTPALRYSGNLRARVKRIAMCGGSAESLLPTAIKKSADAFITSEIKYHTFLDAEKSIALIDAGHFETEQPVLKTLAEYIKSDPGVKKSNLKILISQQSYNPISYYTI